MVFFKIFTKSNKPSGVPQKIDVQDDSTTVSHSSTSESWRRASVNKKMPKQSRRSLKAKKENLAPEKPRNIQVAEAFMASWNNFTNANGREVAVALFTTPNATCHYEDGLKLKADEVMDALELIFKSFPDTKFAHGEITIPKDNKKYVIIDGFQFSGTHTGAPYSMVPGVFPEIEAAGTHAVNDEERIILKLDDDYKIRSMEVVAFGSMTGPPGLYEQIGGSLVPPSK